MCFPLFRLKRNISPPFFVVPWFCVENYMSTGPIIRKAPFFPHPPIPFVQSYFTPALRNSLRSPNCKNTRSRDPVATFQVTTNKRTPFPNDWQRFRCVSLCPLYGCQTPQSLCFSRFTLPCSSRILSHPVLGVVSESFPPNARTKSRKSHANVLSRPAFARKIALF